VPAQSHDSVSPVLIAGAGPSGLALALWLARAGVRPRIIECQPARPATSRAIAVQARTLEFYRQLGIADEVIAQGLRLEALNFWVAGHRLTRLPFGEVAGGKSPYPFILMLAQDQHERLLEQALGRAGVTVERGVTLENFEVAGQGIQAQLALPDGQRELCRARYLAGCDGARSLVRHGLKAGFPGGTYAHLFYVADLDARGPGADGELHVALDEAGILAAFPLKGDAAAPPGEGRVRLIGTIRTAPTADVTGQDAEGGTSLRTWDDVDKGVLARVGITVRDVRWFSTYHVHHRVVDRFREGPVFLVGDAAHIHSPVGGQGMNTGIGDAVNLGWKLAEVLQGRAPEALLDSYAPERRAFATRLVATTDRLFQVVTREGGLARWVRTRVFPNVMPRVFDTARGRAYLFATVSQTRIQYRASALSEGHGGGLRAGDRWPWIPAGPGQDDSFTPLSQRRWQGFVYGGPSAALGDVRAVCGRRGISVQVSPWSAEAEAARVERDAFYLVRPDGHVGFAEGRLHPDAVDDYLARHCTPAT